MDFTIKPTLEKLNTKIDKTQKQLTEEFANHQSLIESTIMNIKSDVSKQLHEHIISCNNLQNDFQAKAAEIDQIKEAVSNQYNRLRLDLREAQDQHTSDFAKRADFLFNMVQASDKKFTNTISKFKLTLKDTVDESLIDCTNFSGQASSLRIKKLKPDNSTITLNEKAELALKYTFDKKSLYIENDCISAQALYLGNNKYLRAKDIDNDLSNATSNITSLTNKMERILSRLSNLNVYVASNNFNTATPSQESLTEYLRRCINPSSSWLDIDILASGSKIKNTFDNHIWILNKIVESDGLSRMQWEDFGPDSVCLAQNDGVHGLVRGSKEPLKGYIDLEGVISINGLSEELASLKSSMLSLQRAFSSYRSQVELRLKDLELKYSSLSK